MTLYAKEGYLKCYLTSNRLRSGGTNKNFHNQNNPTLLSVCFDHGGQGHCHCLHVTLRKSKDVFDLKCLPFL